MDIQARAAHLTTPDHEAHSDRRFVLLALLMSLVFLGSIFFMLKDGSLSKEESACIAHGIASYELRDFRLAPGEPPLACLLYALPLAVQAGDGLDYNSEGWRGRDLQPGTTMSTAADPSNLNFTAERSFWIRAIHALLAGILLCALWNLARFAFNARAALVTIAAFVLTSLAFGWFVTVQFWLLPLVLFVVTLIRLWFFMELPDATRAGWFLFFALLAAVADPAALLLILVAVIALTVWIAAPHVEKWRRAGRASRATLLIVCLIPTLWLGLWVGYGFKRSISPDPTYQPNWEVAVPSQPSGLLIRNQLLEKNWLPQGTVWSLAQSLRTVSEQNAPHEVEPRIGFKTLIEGPKSWLKVLCLLAAVVSAVFAFRSSPISNEGRGSGLGMTSGLVAYLVIALIFARDAAWAWLPIGGYLAVILGSWELLISKQRWLWGVILTTATLGLMAIQVLWFLPMLLG